MKLIKIMVMASSCFIGGCSAETTSRSKPTKQLVASVYWQNQDIYCGGRFNPNGITFADLHSPCGTKARITANNGMSVIAVRNDRGPFVKGRHIDLSDGTAKAIGLNRSIHTVRVEYLE